MSTSTTIYNRAIQLFEQNMSGKRENMKFKKFKQALQDNNVSLDIDTLVSIYDDITPYHVSAISENNSSTAFKNAYGKEIARQAAAIIFDNLTETPTSAMDIANYALSSSHYFGLKYSQEYVQHYNVPKDYARRYALDLYDAIVHVVRRTLSQLADEGLVKETSVYTCGKLFIRLYSLA